MNPTQCVIFDLDGTLIDSDAALVRPFIELGMAPEDITFGHPVEEFCAQHGLDVLEYVGRYDTNAAQPFPGVEEMLEGIGPWAVCSNKHPASGAAELRRLGWHPGVVAFSDAFGGRPKELSVVVQALGLTHHDVVYVGETRHDQVCAEQIGCRFVWAGWNPRTRQGNPVGDVASAPGDLGPLLGLG